MEVLEQSEKSCGPVINLIGTMDAMLPKLKDPDTAKLFADPTAK